MLTRSRSSISGPISRESPGRSTAPRRDPLPVAAEGARRRIRHRAAYDTSFLTLLAPNDVPGLAFRTQAGDWIDVPTVSDAFIVNGGQLLLRWTNDRFLATPHRAVNRTGGERYALAFFCDAQIDWPIAAVPTCVGPGRPPQYETTYYTDYMIRYQARTYDVFDDQAKDAAE
jgi:isopenicillin N synthase-like dioxygenase